MLLLDAATFGKDVSPMELNIFVLEHQYLMYHPRNMNRLNIHYFLVYCYSMLNLGAEQWDFKLFHLLFFLELNLVPLLLPYYCSRVK